MIEQDLLDLKWSLQGKWQGTWVSHICHVENHSAWRVTKSEGSKFLCIEHFYSTHEANGIFQMS